MIIHDKIDEHVPHLEINEVILVHQSITGLLTTIINKIRESCIHLFLMNHLLDTSSKNFIVL